MAPFILCGSEMQRSYMKSFLPLIQIKRLALLCGIMRYCAIFKFKYTAL